MGHQFRGTGESIKINDCSELFQGLVPVLEWICHGIPIHYHKSQTKAVQSSSSQILFPELSIRLWATETLRMLTSELEMNSVSFLQNRLYLALVHTNSSKLRCNILCGLYFLAARNSFLLRWDHFFLGNSFLLRWIRCPISSEELSGTSQSLFYLIFQQLVLSGSSQSHHSLDHLVDLFKLLLQLLRSCYFMNSQFNHRSQSNQTSPPLTTFPSPPPPVCVLDTSSPVSGTFPRITYPPLAILAQHSQILTEKILEVTCFSLFSFSIPHPLTFLPLFRKMKIRNLVSSPARMKFGKRYPTSSPAPLIYCTALFPPFPWLSVERRAQRSQSFSGHGLKSLSDSVSLWDDVTFECVHLSSPSSNQQKKRHFSSSISSAIPSFQPNPKADFRFKTYSTVCHSLVWFIENYFEHCSPRCSPNDHLPRDICCLISDPTSRSYSHLSPLVRYQID